MSAACFLWLPGKTLHQATHALQGVQALFSGFCARVGLSLSHILRLNPHHLLHLGCGGAVLELQGNPLGHNFLGMFATDIQEFASETGNDYGQLLAACTVTTLPIISIFLVFQKHFVGGLTGGAVKG